MSENLVNTGLRLSLTFTSEGVEMSQESWDSLVDLLAEKGIFISLAGKKKVKI